MKCIDTRLFYKIKIHTGHVYELGFYNNSLEVIIQHKELFKLKNKNLITFTLISYQGE